MAAASAQRSLRRPRQARGHALASGLQADGDRRQGTLSQKRCTRDRSRRCAWRLEPDCRATRECARAGQGDRHRHFIDGACAGSRLRQARFPRSNRAGQTQGNDWRTRRCRALRHGGQCDRTCPHRSSQDHGAWWKRLPNSPAMCLRPAAHSSQKCCKGARRRRCLPP